MSNTEDKKNEEWVEFWSGVEGDVFDSIMDGMYWKLKEKTNRNDRFDDIWENITWNIYDAVLTELAAKFGSEVKEKIWNEVRYHNEIQSLLET